MATPQTCDHFLDLCRKSGVVDIAALDALLSVQPLPVDPKQVASLFIQLKLLTRFQASQLLLGKHRGFHFGGLKVLDQLGIGGMGAVYLCEQVKLRRRVAVKVLPTKQSQDEVARERFFREARAVAALDHPNIVRIHDCNTFNEIHYLLMEYVEGSDLQVKIDQQGALPIDEAVGYVVQAASGLQHAHQRGLVHRDIKPSNLLVDKQGVLKILDMGLARFFQDPQDNLTQRLDGGAVVGTIDFLAPEQAVESSSVDSRADIYSLGATLYTLLSGKPPFDGSTTQKLIHHQVRTPPALNQIRAEVPPGLAEIVQKMMAKLPDDRYQSAQEVMDVLAPWVPAPTFCSSSTTTNAPKLPVKTQSSRYLRPPVIPTPAPTPANRKKLFIGIGAGAALVMVLVIALSSGRNSPLPDSSKQNKEEKSIAKGDPSKMEPEAKQTPEKEPPKKIGPPPKEVRLLTRLDLTNAQPITLRLKGFTTLEKQGTGSLPADWRPLSWDAQSITEIGIEPIDEQLALVQRNLEGKASGMLFSPKILWRSGARYEFQLDYRTTGDGKGRVVLYDSIFKNRRILDLPNTNGQWVSHRLMLDGFLDSEEGRLEFHNSGMGKENALAFRQIEIRELPTNPPTETPLETIDFAGLPSFTAEYEQGKPVKVSEQETWPTGWSAECWKAGSKAEVTFTTFGEKKLLSLTNTQGDPSFQLRGWKILSNLQPEKRYRVRLTYLGEAKCYSELQFRYKLEGVRHIPGIPLRGTDGLLQTAEIEFVPVANREYALHLQNQAKGDQSTLHLHSLQLIEVKDPPSTLLVSTSLGNGKPFSATIKQEEELFRMGEGKLPSGWFANTWKPGSTGEVTRETIQDLSGIGLHHLEGTPALQILTGDPVAQLKAGKTYLVRVKYFAELQSLARISLRNASHVEFTRLPLIPTDGIWQDHGIVVTPRTDLGLTIAFQNMAQNEPGKAWLNRLEVFELR